LNPSTGSGQATEAQDELEFIRGPIPGPRTRELTPQLRAFESRNVTYVDDRIPVFWESASGATVTDVDGNRYIDLTAAFGVANSGHSNPYVAAAINDQAVRLMHGMGDVHPTEVKVELLEKLAALAPGDLAKVFLASTGAEAVEAALKTAILATGKSGFAARTTGSRSVRCKFPASTNSARRLQTWYRKTRCSLSIRVRIR
jgi:4-aminobutyrate aminotransferase-like enzyme